MAENSKHQSPRLRKNFVLVKTCYLGFGVLDLRLHALSKSQKTLHEINKS